MSAGPARVPAPRGARGFTLIELMVAVAILAVLAALAAPSFNEAILSNRLASYVNTFAASARLARSEAGKRGATVVMCRSADGASCASTGGWQQGWILWRDANDNAAVDADEIIQKQQALAPEYHFTGNAYSLDFLADGSTLITGGGSPITLSLCRALPEPGRQGRTLRLAATGRMSIEKTAIGSCS